MKKFLLSSLLLVTIGISSSFAFSDMYIANAIKSTATKENIDQRILYTILDIESDFKPFAICMLTTKENALKFKNINNPNIRIKASEYKYNPKKWAVSFYPNSLGLAKALTRAFIKQGFSIDVGLSQINSVNFSMMEVDYIFEPNYNLLKSSKVLKDCAKSKKDLEKTIECYNYGFKERGIYPYYNRFVKSYNKNFGV
jgi:type IV secretion system protein VirB1